MTVVSGRAFARATALLLLILAFPGSSRAGTVRGVVTDPLGARIAGASVTLACGGSPAIVVKASATGEYTASQPQAARCTISASSPGFSTATLESFFLGANATLDQPLTLSVAAVNSQVTVTATGLPTPQAQVSAAVTVLDQQDLGEHTFTVDPMRLVPGVAVVQQGQQGGVTSIFVRGGNSTANKVLINGVEAEDVGGRFDLSGIPTVGLDTIEVHRGADSVLYGADALASVIVMNPPRGSGATPLLTFAADGGTLHTVHSEATLNGAAGRFDYFGGFSLFNTANALPNDAYHNITGTANVGYSLNSNTSLRAMATTLTYASGLPNAWDFYGVADNAKQSDQQIFLSATLDQQTTSRWHNLIRYGAARKREQAQQFTLAGTYDPDLGVTLGNTVTIRGANGYSATGQAVLDYDCCYATQEASNRDLVQYETDYRFSPHMVALAGFRYQDERALNSYYGSIERHNYDYTLQFSGDFWNRLFYTLGGGIQHNEVFGTEGTPRVGLAYYINRPGPAWFSGTKLVFNFARGVQEADIGTQLASLYDTLLTAIPSTDNPNGPELIQQFHITPIGAEDVRNYDGGVEQTLFHQRAVLRARYFHNEFGRQAEYVDTQALAALQINQAVITALEDAGVFGTYVNSLTYKAQGAEVDFEYQPVAHVFVRAGYAYLDAVVQHSFSSDALCNTQYASGCIYFQNTGVIIGANGPLIGARPFRRPPHTGFFSVTYTRPRWYAQFMGAVASRSDDSTFLEYSDSNFGNSLLLPNRNLDPSYEKLDFAASFSVNRFVSVYTQVDNLLNQQRAGVIGYPALPLTARGGLRFTLGRGE